MLHACCAGTHGTTQPIGAAHASKQAHSTFGLAVADYLPSPKRFLKKGERRYCMHNLSVLKQINPAPTHEQCPASVSYMYKDLLLIYI
jgi:hypothetical protein